MSSPTPGSPPNVSSNRSILATFEKYQKDRLYFAQTIAEYATRESNIDTLHKANVMYLLRPLLLDSVPGIQQAAALALGRLANHNEDLAKSVVDSDILPQLVYSLSGQNRFYKKAASFVLRAVSKHSPELARAVAEAKAVEALVSCLEEFDPGVKESAAWALGYVARHNGELAQVVVNAGAIALLVICVQEPELSLRRISASALSDIAKHSTELAQAVVDGNAIPVLSPLLSSSDAKLKRQICSALSQIAKHNVDLAESVVDGDIFPNVLHCFKDMDSYVRKHAVTLVCEILKHSPELAQLVVNSGGVAAIVDYVIESKGSARLPGIMALGYISAFSETLALSVIVSKGVAPLADALISETEEHIKAACAWSLGQIGRHSPDHAKTLSDNAVLPKLLKVLMAASTHDAGEDLKIKTKRALKCILEKTLHIDALDPLLHLTTPPNILKYVIGQFAKILPHDVGARRTFVTSGGLQRIQEIASSYKCVADSANITTSSASKPSTPGLLGTKLYEYIRVVNECYPEEIVRYYSPGYSNTLLAKIEEYSRTEGTRNWASVGAAAVSSCPLSQFGIGKGEDVGGNKDRLTGSKPGNVGSSGLTGPTGLESKEKSGSGIAV